MIVGAPDAPRPAHAAATLGAVTTDRNDAPAPPRPVPSEGSVRVRVRYCECDPMGYVHHSVHPVWMEIARTEALRESGVSYRDMESRGVFLVVAHLSIDYKRPARYDDEVLVRCRVTGTGRAKLEHAYELWRNVGGDGAPGSEAGGVGTSGGVGGELFATARTVLACVGADGRPRPLPEWLTAQRHG